MSDDRHYKHLIFTKHALERMKKRSISADRVLQVLQSPSQVIAQGKPHTSKFIRTISDRTYHIVGTLLPEQHKTLIISVWVRGEDDKDSVMWLLLTAPFKLLWWVVKVLFKTLRAR